MHKPQRSTWLRKEEASTQRQWHVVDLDGQVLGRAATQIAAVLLGKHRPTYTPNVDTGDFVVVVNAGKVKLTGNKAEGKLYRDHTLFPGGIRTRTAEQLLATHPDRVIRRAVWGMLPKGSLGRKLIKKLKIYSGSKHEHGAQRPRELTV